jgi:predicted transcriptional regulator
MMELNSARKIKIILSDYDYENDIRNRLLMADFSDVDRKVLEEILYSSVKIPIFKLSQRLDLDPETLNKSLSKISKTGLFEYNDDHIVVDKQLRKYYEFQMLKFDNDFKPDLEFIQASLKKVPIHILPNWYSIPRTSNNIFESLIEKYLLTPHHFQRFLEELQTKDKVVENIIQDVFTSKNQKVYAEDLKQKYKLTDVDFEKYMLILEYSFALCLSYNNVNGYWKETVTPFYEWKKYLNFLGATKPMEISDSSKIKRNYNSDYIYIEHLETILEKISFLTLWLDNNKSKVLDNESIEILVKTLNLNIDDATAKKEYIEEIVEKLINLTFIKIEGNSYKQTKEAKSWLDLSSEKKAMTIYQHPLNQL